MAKTRPWSDAETSLLKEIFSTASVKEMKEAFPDRNYSTVIAHGYKIGLSRPNIPRRLNSAVRGLGEPATRVSVERREDIVIEKFRLCAGVTLTRHKMT